MDCYITGIGCVSAIGNTVSENRESLLKEESGIISFSPEDYTRKDLFLGNVKLSSEEIIEKYNLQSDIPYSRTTLLGIVAIKEAWGNNELNQDLKTGFINGTSVGGVDGTEKFYKEYSKGNTANFKTLLHHDCGTISEFIAAEIGDLNLISTISTACSSAANAIIHGKNLLEKGVLDRVIVGGVDALSVFTINGFDSLQILDEKECKPFDNDRNGLNLGEGAGYLVLESKKSLENTKNSPIAIFNGGANRNDAYHQTATSPEAEGAYLSMTDALKNANKTVKDIDYINVHGTGTSNNDLTESIAIKRIFDQIPPLSSTKSFTGHTLAACGAIEAIYSIFALNDGIVPANLRFKKEIAETELIPVLKTTSNKDIKTVLSNSFGFGGNNSTLIFSRI